MAPKGNSKNHHWWPVGLQKYWADRRGELSWIDPDGKIQRKKAVNRKIGYKIYGHTMLRGTDWEDGFENNFSIDNEVHRLVSSLSDLKPFGFTPSEFFELLKPFRKKKRTLSDFCNFYNLEEQTQRNLLLFLFSLLIRSPANRSRYESYSKMFGRPPCEEVGKANMAQDFQIAKELCRSRTIGNQYFVLLYSPWRKFIYGDGSLDWITSSLIANRIEGRALVPLTPHVCVYFCTPTSMRTTPNFASISAAPWMVDAVNEITQIYSREKLFFLGRPPRLTDAFTQRAFLAHKERHDPLIDMLDEIACNRRRSGLMSFGLAGL